MANITNFFAKLLSKPQDSDELTSPTAGKAGSQIRVSKHSGSPGKAWAKRKASKKEKVEPVDPCSPIREDCVRFVCISDTHTELERHGCQPIPDADVLLHAGDFTMFGQPDEVLLVNQYLDTLPHKHKIVIAGNHDMSFDLDFIKRVRHTRVWSLNQDNYDSRLLDLGVESVHDLLTSCVYLEDSMVEIYGIKIYGSPWQPGSGNWGFNCERGGQLLQHWNKIPDSTDILLTHCPPCGYGDDVMADTMANPLLRVVGATAREQHAGCVDLLNTVQHRVKPKYHVFGHIHEDYGITTDGITTFINASMCTRSYKPTNLPIVFDVPLPDGYTKTPEETDDPFDLDDHGLRWIIETKRKKAPKLRNIDLELDDSDSENGNGNLNKKDNDSDEDDGIVFE